MREKVPHPIWAGRVRLGPPPHHYRLLLRLPVRTNVVVVVVVVVVVGVVLQDGNCGKSVLNQFYSLTILHFPIIPGFPYFLSPPLTSADAGSC